jgi:hypothetical protein
VREDRHDLQRERRRLLHQELEALPVDADELVVRRRDDVCAARVIVDQTQLTEDVAGLHAAGPTFASSRAGWPRCART